MSSLLQRYSEWCRAFLNYLLVIVFYPHNIQLFAFNEQWTSKRLLLREAGNVYRIFGSNATVKCRIKNIRTWIQVCSSRCSAACGSWRTLLLVSAAVVAQDWSDAVDGDSVHVCVSLCAKPCPVESETGSPKSILILLYPIASMHFKLVENDV